MVLFSVSAGSFNLPYYYEKGYINLFMPILSFVLLQMIRFMPLIMCFLIGICCSVHVFMIWEYNCYVCLAIVRWRWICKFFSVLFSDILSSFLCQWSFDMLNMKSVLFFISSLLGLVWHCIMDRFCIVVWIEFAFCHAWTFWILRGFCFNLFCLC